MKQDDSILEFPVHKVSISKKNSANGDSKEIRRIDGNTRRLVTAASIFSVAIMAFWLNQEILNKDTVIDAPVQSRGLASLGDPVAQTESVWKQNLVKRLAQKTNSGVAARGERPSKLDNIAFGLLAGQYNVNSVDGKISRIDLRSDASAKEIKDLAGFIENFKGLLPAEFSKLERVSHIDDAKQVFSLVDGNGHQVGTLTLSLDKKNHLQALNFDSSHKLVQNQ